MERPIKGGYILISLGLIALSSSYSGSIDYDRISRTKKHIVLTGIKVGDTVMPDICVKPVYGNGTITFEDVYGFDVVVSSNNSVSVSEHVTPSSGTKLYKHLIECGNPSVSLEFGIISSNPNPYNYRDSIVLTVGEDVISIGTETASDSWNYKLPSSISFDNGELNITIDGDTEYHYQLEQFDDTVTEL